MLESVEFQSGDVRASIRALRERLANPAPVLRELARKVTADVRANIKAGGTGWPPYAESTRKRVEKAIRETGYRPNAIARSLRAGHAFPFGTGRAR